VSESNSTEPAADVGRIAARLRQAKSILLVSHDRPDGDAVGAMVALAAAARDQGLTAHIVCESVPRQYAFLAEGEQLVRPADAAVAAEGADWIVILDTCVLGQLTEVQSVITSNWHKLIAIDHHRTCHDIAPLRWCDSTAAATGVMVADLLAELAWPLTEPVARAVMTAVCADTGWLRFSNTDARALGVVARCIDAGASPDALHRTLYQNDRPERLALTARMLTSLQLHAAGQVALMRLTAADFAETGATRDETENLINEAMRIGTVHVAVLLVEQDDLVRGSLRSKPVGGVDVAAIAQQLGGGGHARAAGFRMDGTIKDVAKKVLGVIEGRLT